MNRPLIDARTLMDRAGEDLLIVDCRFELSDPEQGRRDYLQGHLPGAIYASLDEDLSDLGKIPQGLGRHPLPDPDAFARTLGRWGWTSQRTVVAYDTAGGAIAGRLWWMMRSIGASASVLDGGLAAWREAGGALETGLVEVTPTEVRLQFDPQAYMETRALRKALDAGSVTLVDARAASRYRGETEPLDRVAGHVPGAVNRPFAGNLDEEGRFRAPEALRAEFEQLLQGVSPERVVHMCGSGVTACHNLLAMEHAGLSGARLYTPSWSGWVSDPERPVAKDEA
ncbi:sulfurtransferase [Oleiagrimonas sp. MCCC 1A03011]|uniref:sulfurtransferase n=1 Tax=Oleiagrimonas sp. MCCC 1A03011 TaxID=1926883 RepID=UPI000DC5560B|nr:sulfurtransferase [Oleiagrimonas sp. MCCC 1A03011]RAP57295.1 sulfurtransferase [Oleiagrimonas sp. MCCC 1A03011]